MSECRQTEVITAINSTAKSLFIKCVSSPKALFVSAVIAAEIKKLLKVMTAQSTELRSELFWCHRKKKTLEPLGNVSSSDEDLGPTGTSLTEFVDKTSRPLSRYYKPRYAQTSTARHP